MPYEEAWPLISEGQYKRRYKSLAQRISEAERNSRERREKQLTKIPSRLLHHIHDTLPGTARTIRDELCADTELREIMEFVLDDRVLELDSNTGVAQECLTLIAEAYLLWKRMPDVDIDAVESLWYVIAQQCDTWYIQRPHGKSS